MTHALDISDFEEPAGATNQPTTIADGADVNSGAVADAAVAAGASGTVSAKLRRITTDLDAVKTSVSSINTKLASLGQAVMAASTPVAIASNQTAIPVTDNSTSLTTDSAQLPSGLSADRLKVAIVTGAGGDNSGDSNGLKVESRFSHARATADLQVKGAAGFVHTITVAPTGTVTAGVLTVYDSITESGTPIFSVALPTTSFSPFTVTLDVIAGTGIYVGFDGTLANVQATVSYR